MASTEEIKRRIEALSAQSKAGRLRPLWPLIDRRLQEGVSQQAIVEVLQEQGIDISLATFRTYLRRYRLGRRQQSTPETGTEAAGDFKAIAGSSRDDSGAID